MEEKPKQPLGAVMKKPGFVCSDGWSSFDEKAAIRHEIEIILGPSCATTVFENAAILQVLLAKWTEPRNA